MFAFRYLHYALPISVTFLFLQLATRGDRRWIRLVKTNKKGCLDFFLGPKRCIHLEVKVCVRLSSLKSSAHRNFFISAASDTGRPVLDSSRQDEKGCLDFFLGPKRFIHLEVNVCVSLPTLRSSDLCNFFISAASDTGRPALDSSRQDEQERLLRFFPRPKKMYTPRS